MAGLKRNWDQAHEKLVAEGRCRVCKSQKHVQAAHVIGREHDQEPPLRGNGWKAYDVEPDRIVPLCGPVPDPHSCHGRYDDHKLDLLPYLTKWEVLQAVADCASMRSNGLETARIRMTGEPNAR